MKRVSEILTDDNSLFEVMLDEHAELYEELFNTCNGVHIGNTEPSEIDMMLLVNCGGRYAAPLLVHHDLSKVANFLVKKYGDNWKRVKKAMTAEYDVLKPYNVESVTTGEKKATNDTSSESTDKTGVVGFDSEVATDNTVDTNNNTVKIEQGENTNTTVKHSGINGNIPISSLITSEIEVRKNSFISIVVNDIQSQITLDIY